jgi:hypothetical protein
MADSRVACRILNPLNLEPGSRPLIHPGATQECIQPTQALLGFALVLQKYAENETLNPQRRSNAYFHEVDHDLVSSLSQPRRPPPARRLGGVDDRIASWKIPVHTRQRTSERAHTATEQSGWLSEALDGFLPR